MKTNETHCYRYTQAHQIMFKVPITLFSTISLAWMVAIFISTKPIMFEFSKTQLSEIKQLVLKHNSISLCIPLSVNFARFRKSSIALFKISIITATALSIGNDKHKFTKSKEVYISFLCFFYKWGWI